VGKAEGKRSLQMPRHRSEDNTKIDLKKQGGKLWTGLIWFKRGTRN
jgi:hypothetical protein